MKTWLFFSTFFVCFFCLSNVNATPEVKSELSYTLLKEPKQIFKGFGASQPNGEYRLIYPKYGKDVYETMIQKVYKDLDMNWLRLWVKSGEQWSLERMKSKFYESYIDNGLYNKIKQNGAKHLLLAPARGEKPPTESMPEYAQKLAQFIHDIYKEKGIKVDATGVANEPQGFSKKQIAEAIKNLRKELDQLGMQDVKIIAPEWANADRHAANVLKHLEQDKFVWDSLDGISTHSYNMAANRLLESYAIRSNKDYWMTEAGRGLPRVVDEVEGETDEASTVAARFLNDMNHSVTHWFWFIGYGHYDKHPNKDSGQVLLKPSDDGGIKKHSKYYYFVQLRNAFDLGAQFYDVQLPTQTRHVWSHGQKPDITLSIAKNPDNSWSIGIVNTTGINVKNSLMKFNPATTYKVSIHLGNFVNNKVFSIKRSSSKKPSIQAVSNGTLTLDIEPYELITLRSLD